MAGEWRIRAHDQSATHDQAATQDQGEGVGAGVVREKGGVMGLSELWKTGASVEQLQRVMRLTREVGAAHAASRQACYTPLRTEVLRTEVRSTEGLAHTNQERQQLAHTDQERQQLAHTDQERQQLAQTDQERQQGRNDVQGRHGETNVRRDGQGSSGDVDSSGGDVDSSDADSSGGEGEDQEDQEDLLQIVVPDAVVSQGVSEVKAATLVETATVAAASLQRGSEVAGARKPVGAGATVVATARCKVHVRMHIVAAAA